MKRGRLPRNFMMLFCTMVTPFCSLEYSVKMSGANNNLEQVIVLIWVHDQVPNHNLAAIRAKMLSLNWHWPVGRLHWLFFFIDLWTSSLPLTPPPLFQYSFSALGASWERWAQTAGLVKDPSWDADNVFAHRLPCSPLASASLIRTQNSTRNGYFVLKLFFPSLCWAVFVSHPSNSAQ